jgi:hypothetical protein
MKTQRYAHEEKDVDVASMFLIALTLFLSCALICLCIAALMRFLSIKRAAHEAPPRVAPLAGAFPQPRVQVQPGLDLGKLRANENARLDSYGWIDREAGVAHIPIDRAMQLVLERGLPDVGKNETPLQYMQSRPQEIPSPKPLPK